MGVVSFMPPATYHLRIKDRLTDLFRVALVILAAPVSPGRSRIFISVSPGKKLPIPQWLLHTFSNRFLDTDIWVHDQEYFVRGNKNIYEQGLKVYPVLYISYFL